MTAHMRQRAGNTTTRRFSRPGASARRSTTGRTVSRPPMHLRRRPSQTTTEKALGRLKAMAGTPSRTKTGRGGAGGAKRTAGLTAVAGAAALAVMNRDRVTALFSRDHSTATDTTPAGDPPGESHGDDLQPAA
jgi:hypothetical protein